MFREEDGLFCGVFDSKIMRGSLSISADRTVQNYELELFHGESGVSYVENQPHPVRRGMLLCAKPGQIRHSEFPVRCSFIRIPPGHDREIDALLRSLPDCTYLADDSETEDLMSLFTRLASCFAGETLTGVSQVRMNALLFDIIYRICRLCLNPTEVIGSEPVSRITREACAYIIENDHGNCSLQAIAAAVQISPNHLHAVFSRETGMTPFEYVLNRRIVRAQRLIMAGEMSMMEIALETGFCSQSHFNKVFRKNTGMTPVEYRKKLLEQYAGEPALD